MKVRLFRHSGLPPSPDNYEAFRKEFKERLDVIWPNDDAGVKAFMESSEENQKKVAQETFEMEQELFRKYPREETLDLSNNINLRFYVKKYGSLCFVFEDVEGKEKLTAYVMDGPILEDEAEKLMKTMASIKPIKGEEAQEEIAP